MGDTRSLHSEVLVAMALEGYFRTQETAAILGLTRNAVQGWARKGRVHSIVIRHVVFIHLGDAIAMRTYSKTYRHCFSRFYGMTPSA